jgi:hypothetical protein
VTKHDLHNWWFESGASCGCGSPEEAGALMRDVLGVISDFYKQESSTAPFHEPLRALLPGRTYWAVLYAYDKLGLLEHGSRLPGWLSGTGDQVLSALREFGADPKTWGEHASSGGRCGCGQAVPAK